MTSPQAHVDAVYEMAKEYRQEISGGRLDLLAKLNGEVEARNLGERLVMISVDDELLPDRLRKNAHSFRFMHGKIGSFALMHSDEDGPPALVSVVNDVVCRQGKTSLVPVYDEHRVVDVVQATHCNALVSEALALMGSPDFSFASLAEICKKVHPNNFEMTLLAAAINQFATPSVLASSLCALSDQVVYYIDGKRVVCESSTHSTYYLTQDDVFILTLPNKDDDDDCIAPVTPPTLYITTMHHTLTSLDHRNIMIDRDVIGHDLPA